MKKSDNSFTFLFIDIEWNQKERTTDIKDRELTQIGVIGANESFKKEHYFSRYIMLDDINTLTDETYKITHVSKAILMKSKPVKEVMLEFSKKFPMYRTVIFWTRDNYRLFKATLELEGIKMPRHNVVILQEILSKIALEEGKYIGFEAALISSGIEYEKHQLHYAMSDSIYMYKLFKKIYREYTEMTQYEECMINKKSKMIHSSDCSYVGQSSGLENGAKNLIFTGYTCCSRCGTEKMWRRYQWEPISKEKNRRKAAAGLRQLPITEENIKKICEHYSLEYNINVNYVAIKTNFGWWRIYLDENRVESVYHGNYKRNRFNNTNLQDEDFHQQKVKSKNFFDVVSYIFYHDKSLHSAWRKNTVEYMLDKMKSESRC